MITGQQLLKIRTIQTLGDLDICDDFHFILIMITIRHVGEGNGPVLLIGLSAGVNSSTCGLTLGPSHCGEGKD